MEKGRMKSNSFGGDFGKHIKILEFESYKVHKVHKVRTGKGWGGQFNISGEISIGGADVFFGPGIGK